MTTDTQADMPAPQPGGQRPNPAHVDPDDGRFRPLGGAVGHAVFWLGVLASLGHIYMNTFATLPSLWQNVAHFAIFATMGAMAVPLSPRLRKHVGVLAFDVFLGVSAAAAAIWLIGQERAIFEAGQVMSTAHKIAAAYIIVAAIEFTRRATGWIIPGLIVLSLSYVTWLGPLIDGVFAFRGLSVESVLFRSVFNDEGMFGIIASISSTFVFMFILFGAFLLRSGAGEFIIDMARAVAGKLVGGPGFVGVIASALTGTISGSAIANTASTGVITIPMMKRAGFPPKFAGGVEAAASTGGQLMPPIMGAGAFVMANYTQIPYGTIVAVSILPAILYFWTVGSFVRITALKTGIKPAQDADAPNLRQVMRNGGPTFLIPIGLLIYLLMDGMTPTYAAGFAIISVVVASWLTPHAMGVRAVLEALALGARNMMTTALLLIAVGLIVNTLATSGIGNTFGLMITQWAGGNLLIAIALIAVASLVLGMGLPVTAAYIVLATLAAPALQGLIATDALIDAIASGQVDETVKLTVGVVAPDLAANLGTAMSQAEAAALVDALPREIVSLIQGQVLSSETLLLALLSAHMIIFWLSQDSNVTPPVALCAFTAAAIAKTPPMATGVASWKVAKGLYIVPLLFAYTPFLGGPPEQVLEIFVTAIFGLYAFGAAIEGYAEGKLNVALRLVMAAAAAICLWPTAFAIHAVGIALTVGVILYSRRQRLRAEAAAPA